MGGNNLCLERKYFTGILIFIVISVVIVNAQEPTVRCRTTFNCAGPPSDLTTLEECCNNSIDPPGIAYTEDGVEGCFTCPIVIGFFQRTFVGLEQQDPYSIDVGFSSGTLQETVMFMLQLEFGTASSSDVTLLNSSVTMLRGGQVDTNTIMFSLPVDQVAQEIEETFSIRLVPDRILVSPLAVIELEDQLDVTIIDIDEVEFFFSESAYTTLENLPFSIVVSKSHVTLANPVTLQITPTTVDGALTAGIISSFLPDDQYSPNRAADNEDFDPSIIMVAFPVDEGSELVPNVTALLQVQDDNINEALEQRFIVQLEIIDAINLALLDNSRRNISVCSIQDNDDIQIGFDLPEYSFAEPDDPSDVTNGILLVKEDEMLSEQTFFILVTAGIPKLTLLPAATLNLGSAYDYSLGEVGQSFVILTFPPSLSSVPFNFSLNSDDQAEGTEFFEITSSSVAGRPVFLPSEETALVSILDNDDADIGFLDEAISVNEGDEPVTVAIGVTSGSLQRELSIQLSLSDGTAIFDSDYSGDRVIVFSLSSSNTSVAIRIALVNDLIVESDETLIASLTFLDHPGFNLPVTLNPSRAVITILDDDGSVVVGDPFFEVPLSLSLEKLKNLKTDKLSLCYEIHGIPEKWFNLITDECITVNGFYSTLINNPTQNVIKKIGMRTVDNNGMCVDVFVNIDQCKASVNDVDIVKKYFSGGVSIDVRRRHRVLISVPNCNAASRLIVEVMCEYGKNGDMLKFVVHKGLNEGHKRAHGLVGQFWNVPISVSRYTGQLRSGEKASNRYTVETTSTGSKTRRFTGYMYPLDWQDVENTCIYVGNGQGGPIYEVASPNDGVIEGNYKEYIVESSFSEKSYVFGLFSKNLCVAKG